MNGKCGEHAEHELLLCAGLRFLAAFYHRLSLLLQLQSIDGRCIRIEIHRESLVFCELVLKEFL